VARAEEASPEAVIAVQTAAGSTRPQATMAGFTQEQKAILGSTARTNLANSVSRTGKTTVLARKYLNQQERPGADKAIFITANALATQRVLDHLRRITAQSWEDDLIGTFAEIGCKLLKRFYRELSYSKPPQLVSDLAASAEREAARKTALQLHPDMASATFHEQWNQAFVQLLRHKNVATPRSLVVETANLFAKVVQPELAGVRLLLADNVHDFGWDEMLALSTLQQRMEQNIFAGNSNLAIHDRQQGLDPEHWLALVNQDGIKVHPLMQSFGMGNAQGLFLQQLAAFNSKRVHQSAPISVSDPDSQMLVEVTVPTRRQMFEVILDMESGLQLGIRERLLAVVLRNPDDARELARNLNKPYFLQWDKHRVWHRPTVPAKGIICTTPFEAPYLSPDYVVLPNCFSGYWPYQRERNAENCRRAFLRSISSARTGVFFLIPDANNALLPSPFLAEGCTPKLVTKAVALKLGESAASFGRQAA
jgi:hypothetical protein